jgi:hypothetical protein
MGHRGEGTHLLTAHNSSPVPPQDAQALRGFSFLPPRGLTNAAAGCILFVEVC